MTAAYHGVLDVLNRLYGEIRVLEERWNLRVGGGDARVRVEHFHDAVRAFSSEDTNAYGKGGRLSTEALAYDAAALRYLEAKPLAALKTAPGSPSTGLIAKAAGALVSGSSKPDASAKRALAEGYRHYGVLFVALFKPVVDQDFQERTDALNEHVEQMHDVQQLVRSGAEDRVIEAIQHIDDPRLRMELTKLQQAKKKRELLARLKLEEDNADRDAKALDSAQAHYAMAQLALFEQGRDMVKKLAERGLNLAGRFVEEAMAQAGRGRSDRGR